VVSPFEVALSAFLDSGQPLALDVDDVVNPQRSIEA